MTSSDHTKSGQTAGAYLRWICTKDGINWTWTNAKHVQLLWGLWDQYSKRKQKGLELDVIVDSQGTTTTLHVQHIMDSYSRWLHSLDFFDTPHDDDPDGTGNGSHLPTRQHRASWYARILPRTSQSHVRQTVLYLTQHVGPCSSPNLCQ